MDTKQSGADQKSGDKDDQKREEKSKRPFICNHCGKGYPTLKSVNRHKKIHPGEGAGIICPYCDRRFTLKSNLQNHINIHTGKKPYVCSKCGRGFAKASSLRRHNYTHTGEKTHMCEECGRGFVGSQALKSHMLIHSGEKPYMCAECGNRFRQFYSARMCRHSKPRDIYAKLKKEDETDEENCNSMKT